MTRKDYILIAETIRKAKEHYTLPKKDRKVITATLEVLAFDLSEQLLIDNPNFNSEKFLTACGF